VLLTHLPQYIVVDDGRRLSCTTMEMERRFAERMRVGGICALRCPKWLCAALRRNQAWEMGRGLWLCVRVATGVCEGRDDFSEFASTFDDMVR